MAEKRTAAASAGRTQAAAKRRAVASILAWAAAYRLLIDPQDRQSALEHAQSVLDSERSAR